MKSSINTNTISLNGRTVLSSPVMDSDMANKAMSMIKGIARRNNIAMYNVKLDKLGYFNKKAVAKKDTKKAMNKKAKQGSKALEYLTVGTSNIVSLEAITEIANSRMAYILGAVKESAKSVVGTVTRKARKVADKVKMAIDSLPVRKQTFGSLVSKVSSKLDNTRLIDGNRLYARSFARQFVAINKAIASKISEIESLSLVDYTNMSVDSTVSNIDAICKKIDAVNRLKSEMKLISDKNMKIRKSFKYSLRKTNKVSNTNLQLLASRSASTSIFNLDSNNVDIDNDVNNCDGVIANGSASVGKINNTKGEDNMNILNMNLQLLASNKGFTRRDLTGVPNSSEVIKEKESVVLNKDAGRGLGLVITRNDKTNQICVTETLVSIPENVFTRDLEGIDGTLKIGNSVHTFTKEDRFLDRFVPISLDSASSQLYASQPLYMNISKGIIALPVVDGNNVYYKNIRTGRKVKETKLNKYVLSLTTASGIRGSKGVYNAIFVKLEKGETIASSLLNPYLHNIIEHANKSMDKKEAAKFATRSGLAYTGSSNVGEIGCTAFYDDVFDYNKKRDTMNGVSLFRASKLASMLGITEEEACKLTIQARPGGVIKVQIKVLNDGLFDFYCKFLNKTGNLDITGGKLKDINFVYDQNAIKAKIDVDKLCLEVLTFGKMTDVALSKQILEKLFLETALLDKEAGNNDMTELAEKFVLNLGKEAIAEKFAKLVDPKGTVSPDAEYIYEIINQIAENKIPSATKSAMANLLRDIAKNIDKLSFTDGNIFYNTIYTDTAQLFGIEAIAEGEIYYPSMRNIDGKKGLMFKYPSMGGKEFYSFKTISFDTVCKKINSVKGIDKELRKFLIEDYKNMSKDLVVLPASRRVFDSCAGLDIDMDAAALVFTELLVDVLYDKEELVELDTTTIKVETVVISNEVMDEAEMYAERIMKKSAKNENSFARQLEKANEYNPEEDSFHAKMFKIPTTGKIKSVGEVTVCNNKTIAVATEAIKGNFEPIMALINENIGKTSGVNKDYEGLPTYGDVIKLSETTIADMLEEAKSLKLDTTNLIKLSLDINRCFRLYQETTIDGAKTGIYLAMAIMVNSIELKSLQKVKFTEVTDKNGITHYLVERQAKELKTKAIFVNGKKVFIEPVFIEDSMSKIQDKLIEFTMAMKVQFEENHNLYKFIGKSSNEPDASMDSIISNAFYTFSANFPQNTKYLKEIKAVYSMLVVDYVNSLNKLGTDEISEEQKAVLKDQFKLKLSSLSNTVEKLLYRLKGKDLESTIMNKGLILVAIGALTSQGVISDNNANKFAFNIAPHYALSYALASDRYAAECTVLHCADGVEGEVEVVNGFSADNSLIVKENFKHREGGKATLNVSRDEKGKVRATETRVIEIPEIDNSKAAIVLDAKIGVTLDANGNVVLDASGSKILEAVCDAGKVLKAISYDLSAEKDKAGNVKFTFELNGKEHTLVIQEDKVRLNDMKANTKYKVTFGYMLSSETDSLKVQDGKIVLELTK